MDEITIKGTIKYFDNCSTNYRIVIEDTSKDCWVRFKVYEVEEDDIETMLECGLETTLGEFVFGAFVSYKHIFPYYGEEKESSGKYHIQISELEDLKRWHDTVYNVCEMMKRNYC